MSDLIIITLIFTIFQYPQQLNDCVDYLITLQIHIAV